MTAWLSMADWSSPVPGLSVYYQHKKTHQLLCQDPGGGRCANVVIINMRTGLIITVVLQCMFLIDNSRSDLSDKVVKLHLNFTHASCTGIIYTFNFFFGIFEKSYFMAALSWYCGIMQTHLKY